MIAVGDMVLFVPLSVQQTVQVKSNRQPDKRSYVPGYVVQICGRYVGIVDICGQQHTEYIDKVVLLHSADM